MNMRGQQKVVISLGIVKTRLTAVITEHANALAHSETHEFKLHL